MKHWGSQKGQSTNAYLLSTVCKTLLMQRGEVGLGREVLGMVSVLLQATWRRQIHGRMYDRCQAL